MSTIVEATVPANQFALGQTFVREPSAEFRTVSLVADGPGRVMPFLWADHNETDRLTEVIESHCQYNGSRSAL
ncbi:hypothetical protein [Haloarcula sp. CBA1127]|uniref:hypothetical protein n=1 Tax=Haloarcula sp. CBA1127 TaxID=1765055 RepID=UPI00073E9563|nr:hypothetical protein [Haloarcula sp. CBA1127]